MGNPLGRHCRRQYVHETGHRHRRIAQVQAGGNRRCDGGLQGNGRSCVQDPDHLLQPVRCFGRSHGGSASCRCNQVNGLLSADHRAGEVERAESLPVRWRWPAVQYCLLWLQHVGVQVLLMKAFLFDAAMAGDTPHTLQSTDRRCIVATCHQGAFVRLMLLLLASLLPFAASAEGGCPPGQYPVGGQGVQGCAPIPGAQGGATSAPRAAGKWETRWGAIAEDPDNLSTGASVSRKSKRDAVSAAIDECGRQGGKNCKLRLAYHNQCVAFADPTMDTKKKGNWNSVVSAAQTEDKARSNAMSSCQSSRNGQSCEIVYSACSMSEFKSF